MNEAVEVTIEGISPLLMHAFPMEPIDALEKMAPAKQAELSAYKHEGQLYMPGVAIYRCLVSAATYSKGKARASLQKVAAGSLMVTPERCPFVGSNGKYEIDARPVVIPSTKGRVMRYRARLDKWSTRFTVEWVPTLMTEEQLRRIVDDAGARCGLLDFRPERKGPFGRFMVTKWDK